MSCPIDDSVMGACDVSGSVSESRSEWWLEDRDRHWHNGGSWGDSGPEGIFRIQGGNRSPTDAASESTGLRLVLRMDGGRSLERSQPTP